MKRWVFSDGTVFEGGEVFGGSAYAPERRRDLECIANGFPVFVYRFLPPGGAEPLDLEDDWLVHRWLLDTAARHRISLVSSPEITQPEYPADDSDDPDTIN